MFVRSCFGEGLHAEVVFGELEQCGFGLGADERGVAFVGALESGGVHSDGLGDEFAGFGGEGGGPGGNVGGEARGTEAAGRDCHFIRGLVC